MKIYSKLNLGIIKNFIEQRKWTLVLVVLLIIAGVAHGYNMFSFPYYENDEGTYMAQAWAILKQGKFAPYTYWYDHAPAGWIFIALWTKLTGGFFTFGLSINSGRVFMLVLHLLSSIFLFGIAKKLTKSLFASSLAVLFFSLSPLAIFFQRRVLLDNIMVFWLLLSLFLTLGDKRRLSHFAASATAFGVAVLTKESAIFFLPVFIYIVYVNSHSYHRRIAVVNWVSICFFIISIYLLYAVLKGEFFQSGTFLGGEQAHVSLLETISYQLSRKGGFFLSSASSFMLNFKEWIKGGYFIIVPDPIIVIGGVIATVVLLIRAIKARAICVVSFLTITYWFFLARGGEIFGFYIIPLIPFLALSIAILIKSTIDYFSKIFPSRVFSLVIVTIFILPFEWYYMNNLDIYLKDQTTNQAQAVSWIKQNLPDNSIILIDNYAYVDLHSKITGSISIQKNAQYYLKADNDQEIKVNLLKNDWRNINYILFSDQMKYDISHADLGLVKEAYENSLLLKRYTGTYYNIEIRKVIDDRVVLAKAWETYKQSFSMREGETYDPKTMQTTSEGQSYSLLRAAWMNDKQEFDKVWQWTHGNMKLDDKNLFAWSYGQEEKNGEAMIKDRGTATDADQDIALALLFAYKQWGDVQYLNQAKEIIADIWNYETVEIKDVRYVVAGDWASKKENIIYTVNPSYLSPYAYRIFAEADKDHNWDSIVDTSYSTLQGCSELSLDLKNSAHIPADWCGLDKNGKVVRVLNISEKSSNYSYDAIRSLWRIALDYKWYGDQRALTYLQNMKLWQEEWAKNQKIYASYTPEGKPVDSSESLAHYGVQLAYFSIIDKKIADEVYKKKIFSQYHTGDSEAYWGDRNNYYDQNWVWLGMALYADNLPNLWNQR